MITKLSSSFSKCGDIWFGEPMGSKIVPVIYRLDK